MVRGGGPVPSAAPGRSTAHKQARPLPGQECLVRGQEHHPDRGAQRLRVQIHPEQGLSGTVLQLQRPQHLPPVHRVPGSLRLLHASPVHVGNRDTGLPRQRGDPQGGQAGGEDPALQLPGLWEGAEPRGSPVQRVPERRGEHAPRGARAPPLPPPPAGAGGAAGLQPPPPPRGGGRGVTRVDCPGRAVRGPGPGFGEGGGCWSLSCQSAALASPPTPRDVLRRRRGWSCGLRHEGSAFPDAHNDNNNILRGVARGALADSRGWAGLPGLFAGSRPWGEPSESCWVLLVPSVEEEGKQPLHSPTRDPHLSGVVGSAAPLLPPLPLPAHKGSGWTCSWHPLHLALSPTLCIRRLLGRLLPSGAVPEGTGNRGGDNPYLAVPRATTLLPGGEGLGS